MELVIFEESQKEKPEPRWLQLWILPSVLKKKKINTNPSQILSKHKRKKHFLTYSLRASINPNQSYDKKTTDQHLLWVDTISQQSTSKVDLATCKEDYVP